MNKYKTTGKQTHFSTENASQKLSKISDLLEKLDFAIDFELFLSRLEQMMVNHNTKNNAETKQYDVVMMFRQNVCRTRREATQVWAERRDMRESLPRQAPEQRTERREPQQNRNPNPKGTRVRVYGWGYAQADCADHGHLKSDRESLPDMSNVQYVQVRAICKERIKITE